ncbi:unnamed protein product [Porites lobata]|uniref:Uncharacterized protein n=1 Tax=Porites lobata TaxID=104759 RepID=A0ABN8P8K1_9CNID|nr:unnamed protein product [Porites lobata]
MLVESLFEFFVISRMLISQTSSVNWNDKIMEINAEAIGSLSNLLHERGLELPVTLRDLLVNARSLSGKTHNKELRSYIYREMFTFLAHQNGIGDGSSLIYPPEIVDTIRQLYPGDIKNYTPKSKKRKGFYEVPLEELIKVYKEADLRNDLQQAQDGPSSPAAKRPKKE